MVSFTIMALLVSSFISSTLANYTLSQDYTGKAFFDGFEFFTAPDPTNGHVKYIDKEDANKSGIAGLMTGGFANNAVYLGMDAVNEAPEGRRSIRVQSTKAFNHGLIVADIVHMPGGICSIWPAFWMVGPNWPESGEIDIVEGVNEQTSNKMVLHTGPGVSLSENQTFTGNMVTPNCDIDAPGQGKNAGCMIQDSDNATFGEGFNANGGGVFATEWTSAAIKIWFFPRNAIPADVASGTPEPSGAWGAPRAAFAGDFKVDNHFKNLNIVFDTTTCGDWAGKVWADSTCAALAPTCEEFVAKNKEAFREAYWAVNSLKVFETNEPPVLKKRSGGAVLPRLP
jgi:Glycosyl hydrolases family 16